MQQQYKPELQTEENSSFESRLNDSLRTEQDLTTPNDAKPVKVTDLKRELRALREELHSYRVQNLELKNSNRDLNSKLSRLQNTIDTLQRTVREQATKTLDEMFFGLRK